MNAFPLAAAWAALLPLAAAAADAADPSLPVPPPSYRCAFAGLPRGVEPQTTPWAQANADVGQFPRGHIDLLKWERSHPAAAAAAPAASAPEAAPQGQPPQEAACASS